MKLFQALLCLVFSITALAARPHFLSATFVETGGNVVVSFVEAGLGNTAIVRYTASATWDVTFQCFNKAGRLPPAANKQTASVTSSAGGTESPKNGRVDGQITIIAPTSPPPPGDFRCPRGFDPVVVTVTLQVASVLLRDDTFGVQIVPTAE